MKTLEERVTYIEEFLHIPSGETLPIPVKDSISVIQYPSTDILTLPFSPIIYDNGLYEMFYLWGNVKVLSKNTDGKGDYHNWYTMDNGVQYPVRPMGLVESVIKVGDIYYNSGHDWSLGVCYSNFSRGDAAGRTFTPVSTATIISGEDRSLYHDGEKFWCFVRPDGRTRPRKIGLMTSVDFITWSPITTILSPDALDGNKQFYNMSVVKNGSDWWGLVNVLEIDSAGLDTEQTPPYAENDNTVGCQLVHSTNGIFWTRCNDRKDFIPRTGNIKQIYGMPTIVNDKLLIYTFENERRHTIYEDANKNGRYWKIERYEISLTDLNKYKPL